MTATGHAVIGTIIAVKIGNPALAIPLALVSHLAADLFPHWDTATNMDKKGKKRVIIDTIFDIALGFIISYAIVFLWFPKTDLTYVFIMILASQFFDWLMAPYYLFGINLPFSKWAHEFQKNNFDNKLDKPWGIILPALAVAFLVLLAKIS